MSISSELGPTLSDEGNIVLTGSTEFPDLASRWREWHAPEIVAVVKAGTEGDVQEAVRYANKHGMPFAARSGGHGATEALAAAKNAIQIDFRAINHVNVSADGKAARVGGVTGICECVGVSAPILGGGHGWLQGQYGLAADQIISARLVLPNGDAVTVSQDSNPDLFWAIRGAGHNFGLVTEWEYRIYDIKNPKWSYEIFIFSGDKLEALYELTNEMLKSQPPEVIHWGYIINVAELDPEHPIIWYAIIYDGPVDTAREYAKPIHDIGPLMVNAGEATVPKLAALTYMSKDAAACAYGLTSLRYPIGLKTYNTAALRKVYDEIDETFRKGYSTQGVQAVDEASTAFPHRGDEILVTSYIQYKPNPAIDPVAQEYGSRLRKHLLQGSEDPQHLRAYVNYAHGTESLQEMYGWEEWRLEKLKSLKAQWDPENRMRYYAPIM
ncbi:FAD-linked oxidoreductase azaL [Apiospora aurea]|uniref:FAD-linked oxidoreductase azaL n=1 Tax=Apiospora aurea TaxID=335848 RepID=A0ABR1Q7M6_9PEZI